MDGSSPHPCDVYARCLPKSRGYPLWLPEPSSTLPSNYEQEGLQIGDVGFVNEKGRFTVLFNITYGPDHPLHQRLGVPVDFDPIELNVEQDVDIVPKAEPAGSIITSPGIEKSDATSDQGYTFTSSSPTGAILILPDGATSYNLIAHEPFRKFAIEHALDWYGMARELHGECISNGSLYLVTGFYKARSWSLGSFHNTRADYRSIYVAPQHDGGAIARRKWTFTLPTDWRDGPDYNGNLDQTVFISGFRIAVRDDVLQRLTQEPIVEPSTGPYPRDHSLMEVLRNIFLGDWRQNPTVE